MLRSTLGQHLLFQMIENCRIFKQKNNKNMLSKLSKTDKLLLLLALGTLIFSELMWFRGEREGALFVGLWVPSILCFAIFLKLIKDKK